ncbi:Phospholipase A2 venom-like protein, partial [Leptotrombidium deliense]
MRILQITNGTILIQLWSVNNELIDCDFDEEKEAIDFFLGRFNTEVNEFNDCKDSFNQTCSFNSEVSNTSLTIKSITNKLPDDLHSLQFIDDFMEQCQQLHERIRYKYTAIQNKRWKRADLLVFPGTNWCGSGSKTKNYKELGVNAAADRCCRDHDYCKHTIAPFSSKYHLFNYRFHTVSHCDCDERFRSCLRKSNSGTSNLIGKLFFNVVKIKCFVFKKEKICRKRSWWGICLKMKKTRQAYFKDSDAY